MSASRLAVATDFASFNYRWMDYASYVKHEPQMNIFQSEEWNDVQVGVRAEASAWEGKPGEKKKVRVYTNCESVELFLNGKLLGSKANDDKSPRGTNIVSFEVPFEPVELKVSIGKQ